MTYSVNLWGSNPDLDNDDCWTGVEFSTRDEAIAAFNNPTGTFGSMRHVVLTEGEWIEIDGPDIHEERALVEGEWTCSRKQARLDDSAAQSEALWLHRMSYGCEE